MIKTLFVISFFYKLETLFYNTVGAMSIQNLSGVYTFISYNLIPKNRADRFLYHEQKQTCVFLIRKYLQD